MRKNNLIQQAQRLSVKIKYFFLENRWEFLYNEKMARME